MFLGLLGYVLLNRLNFSEHGKINVYAVPFSHPRQGRVVEPDEAEPRPDLGSPGQHQLQRRPVFRLQIRASAFAIITISLDSGLGGGGEAVLAVDGPVAGYPVPNLYEFFTSGSAPSVAPMMAQKSLAASG